nr:calitoxin [Calliactis parasitica]
MKTQVLAVFVLCVLFCLAESRTTLNKRIDIEKRIECKCKGDAPDLSHMTGTVYFSCKGGDGSWSKCNTYTAVADCCHQA